jgi:ribosomal protein L20
MPDSESKIRKILTDDVKWLLTIGTVVVSITLSYSSLMNEVNILKVQSDNMRSEIAVIQNNHLAHIQAAIDKISEKLSAHLEAK